MTESLVGRLEWHNTGPSGYTTAYRPRRIVVAMTVADVKTARRFER